MSFVPNQCVACKSSTKPLKRCSRCQMVSYCGIQHQKIHWKTHKDICQVISAIMKEESLSHLYEKSRGANSTKWKQDRSVAYRKVNCRMTRSLTPDEEAMLRFPRTCFVCHETRQNVLTNCPRCPVASFCKEHPNSSIHDRDCASIVLCQELITTQCMLPLLVTTAVFRKLIKGGIEDCLQPPSSMLEFLDTQLKDQPQAMKVCLSDYLSIPLTLFNAMKKLKLSLKSEVELHVRCEGLPIDQLEAWEILLHFLPDVTDLKIVFFEHDCRFTTLLSLCDKCNSKGKILEMLSTRLEYSEFLNQRGVQKADLVGFFNVNPPSEDDDMHRGVWEMNMLKEWKDILSPLMISTITERKANLIVKGLKSDLCRRSILYNGMNEYAAMRPYLEWEDGGVMMGNKIMVISNSKDVNVKAAESLAKKTEELQNKFFYANVCHVCRSRDNNLITCNRCKMISYCGEEHRKEHWIQHKDVCKIVLGMTIKRGTTNLFDDFKTTNQEVWLKTKIDLMIYAKLTKRKLLDFEEQMFLFPKTCFVCHESEFDLLTTCECGTSLCKYHTEDPRHKKVCDALALAYKISMIEEPPFVKTTVKDVIVKGIAKLPNSIESFIEKYLELKGDTPKVDIPNFNKLHVSELITRPLTFLYALKQLGPLNERNLVIHVIGSTDFEVATQTSWRFVSFFLHCPLKSLKVVFIGPEVTLTDEAYNFGTGLRFPFHSGKEVSFRAESSATRYNEYLREKDFLKPNIIIGFNLDLHESDCGITTCTWKETILSLEKMKVPFVLTAGSKERAEKDHEKVSTLLEKSIDYVCLERNPFHGLIPERDFETEGVRYSNQYLVVYDGSYKGSKKPKEEKDEEDLPDLVDDDGVHKGSKKPKK